MCVCFSPSKFWSCICIGDMFQRLVKNQLKTALENATKPKHELKCGKMLSICYFSKFGENFPKT